MILAMTMLLPMVVSCSRSELLDVVCRERQPVYAKEMQIVL